MEDLYHVSFSTVDDNSSSSSDIFWEGLNDVKKVQFSGAEDQGENGGIDSLYSDFGFFQYDPSEEGYLVSTNQQKYQQLPSYHHYHDYGQLDNLQFDMVSPPLQFDAQFPTMAPLCDSTKDKPYSSAPLASLEILKNYGKGFKRLCNEGQTLQAVDDLAMATNDVIWRKLSTEDIMRIAGTRFIQSSSSDSEPLPFLENHPFAASFSGLSDEEKEDVALAESLLASAEKVGYQQFERANKLLNHCESLSCKTGSPAKRIVHYFAEALRHRIDRETGRVSSKDLQKGQSFDPEKAARELNPTIVAFYEWLPFCQIALFTAVQAIIEDVAEAKKIHVIDLEIRKGGHWTILMQALASRQCPIELLKITAIETGTTSHIVEDTGKRLKEFAQGLNIPFSFNIVMVSDLLQLREDHFEIDPEEALAVYSNYALRSRIQDSEQLETIMRVIRAFSPNVMVVTEIEANHNSTSFVNRFIEALFYFSAFFDCLEACMKEDENRTIIESLYFSYGIRNIVAAEGAERKTRNVKIDVWRAFFSRFGMVEKELSTLSLYQAELVAKRFPCGSFCTFDKNGLSLLVGWKGTPINSVSVWKFL
ncbi:DELLA protein RGL1 [Cajanus cajan]|uniref:DELLA protein RGL2 n=1 Tax=Cajanus cajan TaxID=3821 RepID=A0A151R2H4_CAJCA|nr:DELLA protein RGL1 [Cajanus cajan]KYP36702.1 DELLA protein RGL2 [Cajanus cajan]